MPSGVLLFPLEERSGVRAAGVTRLWDGGDQGRSVIAGRTL